MIKVYFDSGSATELVAIFTDDEVYRSCVSALVDLATLHRCTIMEVDTDKLFVEDIDSFGGEFEGLIS